LDDYDKYSAIPTSRIEARDYKGSWLFRYNYSTENTYFLYSYHNVHGILKIEVSKDFEVIQRLVASWAKRTLGLQSLKQKAIGCSCDSHSWHIQGNLRR
jgi:hypothetical protein